MEIPLERTAGTPKTIGMTLKVLKGRSLILLIDETGDCKKGTSTDYVKRQYIGNVGKKENGIVSVRPTA
jgi:SRSO17 transposase